MFGNWLIRLVAWDGLAPFVLLSAPFVLRLLVPNDAAVVILSAIALPLVMLVVRFRAGKRHILLNRCRDATRYVQAIALCLGILVLLFMDVLMVLASLMPPGVFLKTTTEWAIAAVLCATYLTLMGCAMYPGMKGCRNRLDPLDWLSAAVTCNGQVIFKPLFTVELTDAELPDIHRRMMLIMASIEVERGDQRPPPDDLAQSIAMLDAVLRSDAEHHVEDWHDVITQFGVYYELDGEAPIAIHPSLYPDARRRFEDVQ
ncbi:MAG: hypothetical protein RIC55_25040 [Pirellulaceae bacterium]